MIVAIVGIDGSGKTTQAKLLLEKLTKKNYNALCVNPIYLIVPFRFKRVPSPRKIKTSTSIGSLNWFLKMLCKFLGFWYSMLSILLVLVLSTRKIVVCDRFFYQFLYDIYVKKEKKLIKFLPQPHLTFYLDGDMNTLYSRMDDFDVQISREYYLNLKEFFDDLSIEYSFIKVNAALPKEEVSNIIFYETIKYLEGQYDEV